MQPPIGVRYFALRVLAMTVLVSGSGAAGAQNAAAPGTYQDLVALFKDWRAFEQPAMRDGAPDYTTETLARKLRELKTYQARLDAIKPGGLSVAQQVDYELVRAEMNGFDFNVRVLKSWARDPAFYKSIWTEQSDTPAHEGPTHHGIVEEIGRAHV